MASATEGALKPSRLSSPITSSVRTGTYVQHATRSSPALARSGSPATDLDSRCRTIRADLLVSAGVPMAARLEQEPSAPLRFVDPDFDQTGGANVAVLVAYIVGFAQSRRERL